MYLPAALIGAGAVTGHCYSPWLRFRGGKGVATSLGAFILLTPKSILCMALLFLIVVAAFRYVSLASVITAAAFPLLAWTFHEYSDSRQLLLIAAVSLLVIWKHRQNIARLGAGTESRLGTKSSPVTKSGVTKSASIGATRQ